MGAPGPCGARDHRKLASVFELIFRAIEPESPGGPPDGSLPVGRSAS
jgi:hypothetical protein